VQIYQGQAAPNRLVQAQVHPLGLLRHLCQDNQVVPKVQQMLINSINQSAFSDILFHQQLQANQVFHHRLQMIAE